ncbi:unnamed protein product [Microthlaspi erraticum]|uniref:Uncharacterized protein n=1 Tax=Microthlaspi erraticum TaxID=1685480 RepID=A0A6D2IT18_9BRAS|nr:unnamed protein product [Microthlaspi erraticum]
MGIDAKETGAILWKILACSMSTSFRFMRNHPVLSGVFMFLLTLYIFLPSLLFFLIYSSPVLACAAMYAREKLGLRFSSSESKTRVGEKTGVRCHLKQQRSVRRNARMKVEEWDSQTSEDEKDKVILTSLYNDLLGRTPHFEESPKAIEENVAEEDNAKEASNEEESRDLGDVNVEKPMFCNCEIKEEKHREMNSKEERSEEMDNVNEHGISETERNKRLESLIARRRARRLFRLALDQRNKLQAEETTTSPTTQNNNLQITVPRNNEKRRNYPSSEQIPGSAPSVLLKARNPFDIPYDPQEERPNLKGDSFDEEFSLFNHKDMFFCRHESFCRFSLFSPEQVQCMNSPVPASDISATRKRLDLDNEYMDHTEVTEQKIPCTVKEAAIEDEDKSVKNGKDREKEVEMKNETDSDKEEDDDDSSCSEESESELSRLNNAELREAICHSMDNYQGFLGNQTRNVIPTSLPRGLAAPRIDGSNMFYSRRCGNSHSRTFSVASDMQVEVSEIGSPPTTVDWLDDWSNGGESYMYDTDIDREIIRGEESLKARSGVGSKEENNVLGTKQDQKCVVDERHRTVNDTPLLDRRSLTEEVLEHKSYSSSDLSKLTSSGKAEGSLFHTSASLSSITEEPETVFDSIHGYKYNSENMNYLAGELTDHGPLTSLDSSARKLIDGEVVDVQQLGNDDLCGSPKIIDSNIIDLQQKDQILNSIQGEHDTENTKTRESEAIQSLLDDSLDTPYIESFETEREEKQDEPSLENFTEEVTTQAESPKIIDQQKDQILSSIQGEHDIENTNAREYEASQSLLDDSLATPYTESFEREIAAEEEPNLDNVTEEIETQAGLCGSSKVIDSNIVDHQQEDQILSSIQGEADTENIKERDYEATLSLLDASVDTPFIESFERKIEEEEGEQPNVINITDEITTQAENEILQSDLKSDPGHVLTELLDSEVMEENGREVVKNTDEKVEPVEQEKTDDVLKASSSHPHTQLLEDHGNAENDSDVILLQVQDGNNSALDESADQEISTEGENSGLLENIDDGLTQEHNTTANVEEESIVLEENQNSHGSESWTQQLDKNSSEGISPRTLEIIQKPAHDDGIAPNTVSQDIAKDECAAVANDSAIAENNDEQNLKHDDQVMDKELELNLETMHHNTDLIARKDDAESKEVTGAAMNNAETETTKDGHRALG